MCHDINDKRKQFRLLELLLTTPVRTVFRWSIGLDTRCARASKRKRQLSLSCYWNVRKNIYYRIALKCLWTVAAAAAMATTSTMRALAHIKYTHWNWKCGRTIFFLCCPKWELKMFERCVCLCACAIPSSAHSRRSVAVGLWPPHCAPRALLSPARKYMTEKLFVRFRAEREDLEECACGIPHCPFTVIVRQLYGILKKACAVRADARARGQTTARRFLRTNVRTLSFSLNRVYVCVCNSCALAIHCRSHFVVFSRLILCVFFFLSFSSFVLILFAVFFLI